MGGFTNTLLSMVLIVAIVAFVAMYNSTPQEMNSFIPVQNEIQKEHIQKNDSISIREQTFDEYNVEHEQRMQKVEEIKEKYLD